MAAPGTYTMLREDDPRVQSFHSEPPPAACLLGPGTTSYAVFAPKVQTGKLPVVLFQTGHGSGIASDKPFLERLAAEGFFVIAPDRSDDLRCGLCGLVGFLSGCLCSANAVDGSALKAALEFAKSPANTWRDRADLNQVAMAGFSMGAQEALAAQARLPSETKALLLISPSLMPLANCACAPVSNRCPSRTEDLGAPLCRSHPAPLRVPRWCDGNALGPSLPPHDDPEAP